MFEDQEQAPEGRLYTKALDGGLRPRDSDLGRLSRLACIGIPIVNQV